jgi:hypothetical protein
MDFMGELLGDDAALVRVELKYMKRMIRKREIEKNNRSVTCHTNRRGKLPLGFLIA